MEKIPDNAKSTLHVVCSRLSKNYTPTLFLNHWLHSNNSTVTKCRSSSEAGAPVNNIVVSPKRIFEARGCGLGLINSSSFARERFDDDDLTCLLDFIIICFVIEEVIHHLFRSASNIIDFFLLIYRLGLSEEIDGDVVQGEVFIYCL